MPCCVFLHLEAHSVEENELGRIAGTCSEMQVIYVTFSPICMHSTLVYANPVAPDNKISSTQGTSSVCAGTY